MEHHRPNRRADLAIAMVALVSAVLSLGPWRFPGPESEGSSSSEHAVGEPDSERRSSDSLSTPAELEADFRGCDRDWSKVTASWTADPSELDGPTVEASPAVEPPK